MINELMSLTKSLLDNGIIAEQKATCLKPANSLHCFLMSLNPDSGTIVDAEYIPTKDIKLLWRLQPNNMKSFPITNLKESFYTLPEFNDQQSSKDWADTFTLIRNNNRIVDFLKYDFDFDFNYTKGNAKDFSTLLYTYPKELLKSMADMDEGNQFLKLITVLSSHFDNVDLQNNYTHKMFKQCAKAICTSCMKGKIDNGAAVLEALFGNYNSKTNKFDKPKIQIGIHLVGKKDETFKGSYEEVNTSLYSNRKSSTLGVCAATGKKQFVVDKTFPKVELPVIGDVILFSMFKAVPAYYRYGHIGASLFPIGEDEVNKLCNALLYITAAERKNKTWCAIPSHKRKGRVQEKDLLISWVSGKAVNKCMDTVKDALAGLFKNQYGLQGIVEYEAETSKIIKLFKNPKEFDVSNLTQNVLLLHKLGKGRTVVKLSTTQDLQVVLKNITEWSIAAKEGINFKIPVFFKDSKGSTLLSPYTPSPLSVLKLLSKRYKSSGEFISTRPVYPTDVLHILLKNPTKSKAIEKKLLNTLLINSMKMLLNLRNAQIKAIPLSANKEFTKVNAIMKNYKTQVRLDALVSIAFMEILLNRIKGRGYEMSSMHNLGKLIARCSQLHCEYAIHARNGAIPSNLLGNSLVKLAVQNPMKAFAALGNKISLYKNWAEVYCQRNKNKENKNKEVKKVGYLLTQIGTLTREINVADFTKRVTDEDKAMLTHGYLSWENKKEVN